MKNSLLFSKRLGYPLRVLALQSALALPLTTVAIASPSVAQELVLERRVTFQAESQTIESVLNTLEKQLNVHFVYSPQLIGSDRRVTLRVTDKPLAQVLSELLAPRKTQLEVRKGRVILSQARPDASAADVPVSGRVTQGKGQGLPGVTVVVKGTTQGTTTDVDGNFSMTVPAGSVLQFSFIGFNPKEVTVQEATTGLEVALQENSQSLDNVVVIGYGSLDKREVTSTVTHVDNRDLLTVGAINPLTALQGKVAGLTIANGSAADPNSQPSIQLRGVSSRNAGLGPLIVINGVPGGNLENINQNDIESIDVLKGGAASAIYGTRGGNGVIVVTTKKGTKNNQLDYNAYTTFDYATLQPEVLSADEFLAQQRGTDYGAKTNWQKELTRSYAFAQKHSLSASGGTENSNYRATVDYRNAEGIDVRSGRQEYGARISLNHNAPSKLYSLGLNFAPRYVNIRNADYGSFEQGLTLNPTIPVRDPNDPTRYNTIQSGFDGRFNPAERLQTELSGREGKILNFDATFKLNILPTLSTQVTYGQFTTDNFDFFFRPSTSTFAAQNEGGMNSARRNYSRNDQRSLEWIGNYSLDVQDHSLQALAGYSYQYFTGEGNEIYNRDFPSDALTYNNIGTGLYGQIAGRNDVRSYKDDSKLIAFFGRVNYSFKDKYLMSASLRREGSTKFGTSNKWGNFPAASVGWRIGAEPFMAGQDWINELKLRADYGVTGNQDFGNYRSLLTYTGFGYYMFNGTYYQVYGPNQNLNDNLRWEEAQNFNLGVDFALFNSKLTGSVNYYTRRNKNLLGDYRVPIAPNPQQFTYANVGNLDNSGVEVQINAPIISKPNFQYAISFAGATNGNQFVSFSNNQYQGGKFIDVVGLPSPGSPGNAQRLEEGQRVGSFYMLKSAGVDDGGRLLVYTKDGNIVPGNQATLDDRQVVGNGLPKYTLSLGNTFTYKNFDASVFFRSVLGFDVFNTRAFYIGTPATQSNANVLTSAYDDSKYAKLTSNTTTSVLSDYFLERGDFVKLDNVSLGYTFQFKSKYARSLRLYAAAKNVLTVTGYTGGDPDIIPVNGLYPGIPTNSDNNGTRQYYPSTTQVLFGLQFGL
ncbi:SusC/RagA family TonB-linked outer membrane protein [Hymenobacter sp. YC55]|uniref:SusC/RagA family TonB-linked outer membrane protein n=1 Tax=Hymenobacter sp. YC55 TaxID=3034019 RepID=UPI0023F9E506|nr:SusC/RagA family TonB-linked outer membrane protein [Hymenobacter sp. YC55]MDF7814885.1 SusC/RagA family TonB-linked outer membrane protein [Hymenobacter sp. YC55]